MATSMHRQLLNKVPQVTLVFWIIKMMSTTVGETAADFLIFNVGLGLPLTSLLMSALLIALLVWQVRLTRYVPTSYWLVVVFVSVVGTLVSDYLVDGLGISLITTSIVFGIGLAVVFAVWYAVERTLSIHTIHTRQRELFYWAAILFTFALGTSAGDLVAETFALGYATSAIGFGALIGLTYLVFRMGGNAVLTFWIGYILTPPVRRIARRPPRPTHQQWRPGPGHHRHQHPVPRRHRQLRHLSQLPPAQPTRSTALLRLEPGRRADGTTYRTAGDPDFMRHIRVVERRSATEENRRQTPDE